MPLARGGDLECGGQRRRFGSLATLGAILKSPLGSNCFGLGAHASCILRAQARGISCHLDWMAVAGGIGTLEAGSVRSQASLRCTQGACDLRIEGTEDFFGTVHSAVHGLHGLHGLDKSWARCHTLPQFQHP